MIRKLTGFHYPGHYRYCCIIYANTFCFTLASADLECNEGGNIMNVTLYVVVNIVPYVLATVCLYYLVKSVIKKDTKKLEDKLINRLELSNKEKNEKIRAMHEENGKIVLSYTAVLFIIILNFRINCADLMEVNKIDVMLSVVAQFMPIVLVTVYLYHPFKNARRK